MENIAPWGQTSHGDDVHRIRLSNGDLEAHIISFGASVQDLRFIGHDAPLVLGLPDIQAYENHGLYFGAIVGRCANRIGGGTFTLDGKAYEIEKNDAGENQLHGGSNGFGTRIWSIEKASTDSVTLKIESADGDMGYPGNLVARCTYTLGYDNCLDIELEAQCDAPTLCNLTNHSYFNLDNGGKSDVNLHRCRIDASQFLSNNETNAPTGIIADVSETANDFRSLRPIGDFNAYDLNLCLSGERQPLREVARLVGAYSGIEMDVFTTEAGIQLYTARYLPDDMIGLDNLSYGPGSGICLETQVWPDAINHQSFPNVVLRPDETLCQKTQYRFSRQKAPHPA